jgi:hypothetical protein
VIEYNRETVRRGIILSFLLSIVHVLIIFLNLKKGIKERGIKTLLIITISNNIFFTFNGRYQNNVGAVKIINRPYRGMNSG